MANEDKVKSVDTPTETVDKRSKTRTAIVEPDYDKARATRLQNDAIPNVPEKLKEIQLSTEVMDNVVNQLIEPYCRELSKIIEEIDEAVMGKKRKPSDDEIDYFILNLPIVIFYTVEGLETMGIQDDVSKAIREERYNYAFSKVAGTIPDKTAFANGEVQEHTLINIAYQRAYKKIKQLVEAANEVQSSLKKVHSKRMLEMEMNRRDYNG